MASGRSPGYPNFCPIQLQIGGLTTPSSGSINLLQRLRELRETLPYVHHFIKGYEKDTGEQSGEEMHKAWSGRVPREGASVPMALGCIPSGYMTVLSHLGAQRTPYSELGCTPSRCMTVLSHLGAQRTPYSELGCTPSGHMTVLSHLGAQRTPYSWDVTEVSSRRCGPPFTPLPAPSPLWRAGGRDENSKLLITALSFW